MPWQALSVRLSGINSPSNGIYGCTGGRFTFVFKQNATTTTSLYSVAPYNNFDSRIHIVKNRVTSIG